MRIGVSILSLRVVLVVAVVMVSAFVGSADATGPGGVRPVVKGKRGEQLEQLLATLDSSQGGFWGSVLVANGKQLLLMKSYGKAPGSDKMLAVDALWDWASVSKQFTAAAILRLELEGKLALEDSIRKWFPGAPEDKASVTLRHLLNHTSGINNDWREGRPSPAQRDVYVGAFLEQPMISKPGEQWAYNNEAYSALAAVVEKASKMKFEEYCQERLFKPARMKDTFFIGEPSLDTDRVPKDDRGEGTKWAYFPDRGPMGWNYRGMGGTVASTLDMWKWHHALNSNKILNAPAKKKLYEVGLNDYALGWFVKNERGETFYSHSGRVGKHITYYQRSSSSSIVVAIVYGYDKPSEDPGVTAMRLYKIAAQK